MNRSSSIMNGSRRRGLSLAEVMISLAITSMLLTAIAAAFQSSSQVIENNDRFFRATQSARVAINQITTEVRRCDAIVRDALANARIRHQLVLRQLYHDREEVTGCVTRGPD